MRESGRVGSIFDPGGSRSADLAARVSTDDADARERERSGGDDDETDNDAEPSDEPRTTPDPNGDDEMDLDEGLDEMKERFENLELDDVINHYPNDGQADWQ